MNVIDSYLTTLFTPYPETARLREAKRELRAMMEDKLQSLIDDGKTEAQALGIVIAEFGSLEEAAPELGLTAEHISATELEYPRLSVTRARDYAAAVRRRQGAFAAAVSLFPLAPVTLLVLLALTSESSSTPPWTIFVGLLAILGVVAAGVIMLITRSSRLHEFADIEALEFTTRDELHRLGEEYYDQQQPRASRALAISIGLWILSVVPVIAASLLVAEGTTIRLGTIVLNDGGIVLLSVALLLIVVAVGLFILLRERWAHHIASVFDQDDDEEELAHMPPALRVIAAAYWPVVVAVFLAWSFIGNAWGISWLIWPIAGILYGALFAVSSALTSTTGQRNTVS